MMSFFGVIYRLCSETRFLVSTFQNYTYRPGANCIELKQNLKMTFFEVKATGSKIENENNKYFLT